MPAFKDNFSKQAELYLKFRPQYPDGLYTYLASLTNEHELVWDCGTGNGQAALGLAGQYAQVVATDPSEEQIRNAFPCKNVRYEVSAAEQSTLPAHSVDLITVANALHWFAFDAFYAEADRVLKPGGILAAWCYVTPSGSPEINSLISYLHDVILGDYWLPENRLVEKKYSTIPFPYTILETPIYTIEKYLSCAELEGLFHTWSAVQRYKDKTGQDPVALIKKDLETAWGNTSDKKMFTWELTLKVGRK